MEQEQIIQWAERIADALPGVARTEWNKWTQLATSTDIATSLHWSKKMAVDVTLRGNIRAANKLIAESIGRFQTELLKMTPGERRQVFGYVAWILATRGKAHNAPRPERGKPGPGARK